MKVIDETKVTRFYEPRVNYFRINEAQQAREDEKFEQETDNNYSIENKTKAVICRN